MALASASSSPSHSSAIARGRYSSDIAKARWAATASIPVPLWMLACRAAARNLAGTPRAFAFASWRKQTQAFPARFARPPQRPEIPVCTALRREVLGTPPAFCGWRLFARRGPARARPLAWAPRCEVRGHTNVVSTATWAPCQSGNPFANTSIRRESASGKPTFMSRGNTLVATRAPASRHMRAATRSKGALRAQHPASRTVVAQWIQPLARGVWQRRA